MKNLRLIPGFHKQEAVIKVAFTYDNELIPLVKAQKGVGWSQTLRSWYFPKKGFQLNAFYQALKGKAFIDYSQLKKLPLTAPPPIKNPKEYKPKIELLRLTRHTRMPLATS